MTYSIELHAFLCFGEPFKEINNIYYIRDLDSCKHYINSMNFKGVDYYIILEYNPNTGKTTEYRYGDV